MRAVVALILGTSTVEAQGGTRPAPDDRRAAEAAMHAMSHEHDAARDRHLRLTAPREATAADSARANRLLTVIRRELDKYRDVGAARAAGFEEFLPQIPQPVSHFVNWFAGMAEVFSFDAARPTALLYRKESTGHFTLTGAMYTAPPLLGEAAGGRFVPRIFSWMVHVNAFESDDPRIIWGDHHRAEPAVPHEGKSDVPTP